jgi:hypothetical protein
MVFTLRLRTTGSILIKTAVRSGLRRNGRCVIHGVLTRFDPNPHAVPCNRGQTREQKIAYLCGNCKPMQPSATNDRTLVISKSAVRVRSSALYFSLMCRKITETNEGPRHRGGARTAGSRAGSGRSDWRAPPEEAGFWDVIRRVGFVALFPNMAEQLVAVARGASWSPSYVSCSWWCWLGWPSRPSWSGLS